MLSWRDGLQDEDCSEGAHTGHVGCPIFPVLSCFGKPLISRFGLIKLKNVLQ